MQVLELLPPDWPITTVKAFLMHSLRASVHTYRTVKIEHSLARGENIHVSKHHSLYGALALLYWASQPATAIVL